MTNLTLSIYTFLPFSAMTSLSFLPLPPLFFHFLCISFFITFSPSISRCPPPFMLLFFNFLPFFNLLHFVLPIPFLINIKIFSFPFPNAVLHQIILSLFPYLLLLIFFLLNPSFFLFFSPLLLFLVSFLHVPSFPTFQKEYNTLHIQFSF